MVTAEKLRMDAAKMDAVMEAFEHTYLHLIDECCGEMEERTKAVMAVYALRDMLNDVTADAIYLSTHMEVCNAVFAVNHIKRMEGEE